MSAPAGEIDLCLPAQWTDVLLAPADGEDLDGTLTWLVRATWPAGPQERWDAALGVLRTWRDALRAGGVVSHGLVSGTRTDGSLAAWQVMTSVVSIPAEPEVDLATLLSGLLQAEEHDVVHVERFATEVGLGLGIVAVPELQPPGDLDRIARLGLEVRPEPVKVGMTAALAWEQGAQQAILVVGLCLAPDQVLELAGVVAVIAGRSRLRPAADPVDDTGA